MVFIKHVDALEAREHDALIGTVRQPSSEGRRGCPLAAAQKYWKSAYNASTCFGSQSNNA